MGNPNYPGETDFGRFARQIVVLENGCWEWLGKIDSAGYGRIFAHGQSGYIAHRWAFEHFVGPIADGLWIDHVCHSEDLTCPGGTTCPHRRCVNPSHLEAVTPQVNVLRGRGPSARQARQTHCLNGHEFTEENTRWRGSHRHCRTCDRTSAYAHWLKAREASSVMTAPLLPETARWAAGFKNRDEAARAYADLLLSETFEWHWWPYLNTALFSRWSASGLNTIKTRAWRLAKEVAS